MLKAQNYQLVWSDEFDYFGLPNPDKWDYEKGYLRNGEAQYYTNARPENAYVENGFLTIAAQKENTPFQPITSASLITKGKQEFLYGRFEMRAKIDIRYGSWPCFWTLGSNIDQVGWPKCGEIDIMEYYQEISKLNVYYGDTWNTGSLEVDKAWGDSFHVWRMDWDSISIKLFLDGQLTATEDIRNNPVFHKPVYLLLSQAIGGSNGGQFAHTIFPMRLIVDYIRVYKEIEE
jgi:beta-glucanase (GH16 family)